MAVVQEYMLISGTELLSALLMLKCLHFLTEKLLQLNGKSQLVANTSVVDLRPVHIEIKWTLA